MLLALIEKVLNLLLFNHLLINHYHIFLDI